MVRREKEFSCALNVAGKKIRPSKATRAFWNGEIINQIESSGEQWKR